MRPCSTRVGCRLFVAIHLFVNIEQRLGLPELAARWGASRALCAVRFDIIFFAHSFVVSFIMVWYGVWCALLQMVPIVVAMGTVGCARPTYILLFGSSQNLTKISQTHQSARIQPNSALMPNHTLCHSAAQRTFF